MLTLLGSLLGFLGSMFPEFLKFFQSKVDNVHELQILDRQIEMMKMRHTHHLEEIRQQENVEEIRSLYNYPRPVGILWVDILSGSVRPVVTYGFFCLYFFLKVMEVIGFLQASDALPWSEALDKIWHEEDHALLAAVMSFWFGHRALKQKPFGWTRK